MHNKLNWVVLETEAQLAEARQRSWERPVLLFKHSTRCEISSIAKYRLEDDWDFEENQLEAFYLDLIRFRSVSTAIADTFGVYHESPQVLLLVNGECVFDASHLDITVAEIKEAMKQEAQQV
jgi:bacillithiol system protein YtxJ